MSAMTDQIPVLDTPRLTLRAPKLADLAALTAFYATERSHLVGGPRDEFETFSSLAARIGHWALHGYGLWHLDSRETGEMLGWVGVMNPPGWQEPELAWALFASAEGKGLAQEAARAARNFAAQEFKLDPLISYILRDNHRSANLARRLGATIEAESTLLGKPCNIWRHPSEQEAA